MHILAEKIFGRVNFEVFLITNLARINMTDAYTHHRYFNAFIIIKLYKYTNIFKKDIRIFVRSPSSILNYYVTLFARLYAQYRHSFK